MKKVLIAEDEASIREFIVINLKRSGYDVVEAENGEEAINKYEEENGNIDVAVLDIMMPLKDGLEVCKYLRAKSSKIGIIMLTAKTQEMDKVTGLFFVRSIVRPCLLYTSPSPRDSTSSRMPSSA